MIKNRIAQIIFETVYCTLAVIGFIASLGIFDKQFSFVFYMYYTNLSNYICMGLMFVCLIKTVKNSKQEGFVDVAPKFNFASVVMILITCIGYNFLLAGQQPIIAYFTSISNLLLHLILPIMFVVHYILFYEHKKIRWYYPFLAIVMPIIYVIFILIRAWIINDPTYKFLYPYYFLDLHTLGVGKFFIWILILFAVFMFVGYLLYFIDKIKLKNKNK